MDHSWVMDLAKTTLETTLLVGGPMLVMALLVGLLVSIFQALTQINEATLTFIPKILAVGGTMMILGPWLLRVLTNYTTNLYENIDIYLR
jgi:flagellar biosynthetic protein FliQ